MMTEADWAALNEHLEEVRPIFDAFCSRHGFTYTSRGGRYPRIRIGKTGATRMLFDLFMEFDEHGRRFEKFRRDLPYELSAGAFVDVKEGSKYPVRYQKFILCFSGKPFDQVADVLDAEMEKHLPTIAAWDPEYLKKNGTVVQLPGESPYW